MIKGASKPKHNKEKDMAQLMADFVTYASSPWRLVWVNFVAGVFRGLGALVGVSIVIALIIWLASLFVDVPLIGEYAERGKALVQNYVNKTDYNEEFERIGGTLERIEAELEKANETH